ncbi:hypothetical protein [Lysobacter capsici]|uniref:hypothetical protein n=1 Tax=Lysobacter capsici TaxID=435897 RepID=UPI000BBA4A8D|nr:hypothetical protein [Lysobacter capsici]ATE72480.1 hypothetical protein CNO08_14610 [Lysobacter capsici]
MRTDGRRGVGACVFALALTLSIGCQRPAPDASADTGDCPTPASLPQAHRPGWCALPSEVRAFASEHEDLRGFSGGEPSTQDAMHALQQQAEQRLRREREQWARLRARHQDDPATAAWLDRYGEETELR